MPPQLLLRSLLQLPTLNIINR
ncbi:unnamed protein product, partial [Allacma fusca]